MMNYADLSSMNQVREIFTLFLGLVLTSLPFLLLGVIISSLLLVFVDEHWLAAKFPRNRFLGTLLGSSLGLILPVGQYGNIPVARRLLLQGIPPASVFSFLVAAPTLNVFTLNYTWRFFQDHSSFIFYRFFLSWLMALVIGVLFGFYEEKPRKSDSQPLTLETRSGLVHSGSFLNYESDEGEHLDNPVYQDKSLKSPPRSPLKTFALFIANLIQEFLDLGWWLIFGCAIASIAQYFLSQSLIFSFSTTPFFQIGAMILLSFLLSLGSVFNAFLPTTFIGFAWSGSILSFLLFGSVFDLKSLPLLLVTFRLKIVIYLCFLISLLTMFFSLIINYYIN